MGGVLGVVVDEKEVTKFKAEADRLGFSLVPGQDEDEDDDDFDYAAARADISSPDSADDDDDDGDDGDADGGGAGIGKKRARGKTQTKKARGSGSASSGKRKAAADGGAPKAARAPSAFHLFMKAEVARLKAERPGLVHIEALKLAGSNWKKSLAQYGASSAAVGTQDGASAAAGGSAP